jgi:hypothetical protein
MAKKSKRAHRPAPKKAKKSSHRPNRPGQPRIHENGEQRALYVWMPKADHQKVIDLAWDVGVSEHRHVSTAEYVRRALKLAEKHHDELKTKPGVASAS